MAPARRVNLRSTKGHVRPFAELDAHCTNGNQSILTTQWHWAARRGPANSVLATHFSGV
jgi:hypothetical protein